MIIKNIVVTTENGYRTLSAQVGAHEKDLRTFFFSVAEPFADLVLPDASPFVAALYLPAIEKRENLVVGGSVSEKLFGNLKRIYELWGEWFPKNKSVEVKVGVSPDDKNDSGGVGLFFSGGVDSFYTYFHSKKTTDPQITHFIFVHGFDIPLNDAQLYRGAIEPLRRVSDQEGIPLIEVKTNLREFTERMLPWDFAHGGALAAVALLLRGGLKAVYFSGALPKEFLRPYGLHADLDPLWSTEALEIIHIGSDLERLEKIKFISQYDIIFSILRVCWRNKYGKYNCGECEKCIRTMLGFYAIGMLEKVKTFDRTINPKLIENLYLSKTQLRYYQEDLAEMKHRGMTSDIVQALEICIQRNERRNDFLYVVYAARAKIGELDAKYLGSKIFRMLSRKGWI